MNARFWDYYKGDVVKITLRPDQKLTLLEGGPNEEGFCYSSTTYFWKIDEYLKTLEPKPAHSA